MGVKKGSVGAFLVIKMVLGHNFDARKGLGAIFVMKAPML